jgi:hypothetical protein
MFNESIDQGSVVQIYKDPYQQAITHTVDVVNRYASEMKEAVIDLAKAAATAGKTRAEVFADLKEAGFPRSDTTFYRWLGGTPPEVQALLPAATRGPRPGAKNSHGGSFAKPTPITTTNVNSTTATATPIPDRPPTIQAQLDRLPPAPVVEEDNETDDTPTFASLISQPAPASVSYEEALETLRRGIRGDLENFIKAIGNRALEAFVEELGNLLGLDVH